MKRFRFALLATVWSALALTGCGGGGSSTNSGDITRTLLDGGGVTSGTGVTTKTWRVVAISGNQNYPSSGSDLPCPAKLTDPNNSNETLECGTSDIATITSDGTFKFQGFGKTWSLNGTKVTLDFGTAFGTQISEVISETVNGKQRLRLLQVSLTKNGALQPHDDGCVIVLEEAAQ